MHTPDHLDVHPKPLVYQVLNAGVLLISKRAQKAINIRLKRRAAGRSEWTRVGKNAEMVAWKAEVLHDFPYPLDVALERFWVGDKQKHASLLHFGTDPVTTKLTDWFERYNAR